MYQRPLPTEALAEGGISSTQKKPNGVFAMCKAVAEVLNHVVIQTILYFVFVIMFQQIAMTVRVPKEYYLDKAVMDRLIENHFDSSHNTFETVRRIADIYEWGNNVFWPGMFADMGPCQEHVGSNAFGKTCNDDSWPDGEGSFHMDGATPYWMSELVERMDQFDWTEGITIRQARSKETDCPGLSQLGGCFPDLEQIGQGSTESYGYNITHPESPLTHPFVHFSTEDLGGNPDGMVSAAIPSQQGLSGKAYETSGFVALVTPFFSDTFLPFEEGTTDQITDFRLSNVNTTNGRTPRFYCVRTSTNGLHVRQLCDPGVGGNGTGALTGAVRREVELMWNDLKRAHWIDSRTRVIAIVLQLKANNVGVRFRVTLMFELTSLGTIFPSYDVETRILDTKLVSDMTMFTSIALGMVIVFCILEGVECMAVSPSQYFRDMWNVMDWANFLIFFVVFNQIMSVQEALENPDCSSYACAELGYFDDWKLMGRFRNAKMYLSFCVCIQLFKILKFAAQLVPRTGLATQVLRRCCVDLVLFLLTFVISMLAFSMMMYVQLGPVMESYWDQFPAFISLFRALLGDFDINDIMDNSSGYVNTIIFLGYLFVAIFIMLSMFLAILAEGQVAFRDEQLEGKPDPIWNPENKEFGVLSWTGDHLMDGLDWTMRPLLGDFLGLRLLPGLQWKLAPSRPDSDTGEIHNLELAAALETKCGWPYFRWSNRIDFTLAEFKRFGVDEVTTDSFVRTGGDGVKPERYFVPSGLKRLLQKPTTAERLEKSLEPLAVLSGVTPADKKATLSAAERARLAIGEVVTISHNNGGSIPIDLTKLVGGDLSRDGQILAAIAALQGEVRQLRAQMGADVGAGLNGGLSSSPSKNGSSRLASAAVGALSAARAASLVSSTADNRGGTRKPGTPHDGSHKSAYAI